VRTRIWAEVSLETIAHNFRLLSDRYGDVAAVVPVPASGVLLLSGLMGLTAAGRRRPR